MTQSISSSPLGKNVLVLHPRCSVHALSGTHGSQIAKRAGRCIVRCLSSFYLPCVCSTCVFACRPIGCGCARLRLPGPRRWVCRRGEGPTTAFPTMGLASILPVLASLVGSLPPGNTKRRGWSRGRAGNTGGTNALCEVLALDDFSQAQCADCLEAWVLLLGSMVPVTSWSSSQGSSISLRVTLSCQKEHCIIALLCTSQANGSKYKCGHHTVPPPRPAHARAEGERLRHSGQH